MERVHALGLHDRLNPQPQAWREGVGDAERAAGEDLLTRVRANAAAAGQSDERLRTTIGWLELFVAAYPHRILFLPLGGESHFSNAVHNEETFAMLSEFIRRSGSRKPGSKGKLVTSAVIAGYISALRQEVGLGAGYRLFDPQFAVELPRNAKFHRREDGAAATRKLRRGVRAQHFAAAAQSGFDRSSPAGIRRWARALVAHNLLLRGGEPGVVDGGEWKAEDGHISWASVTWLEAGTMRRVSWVEMVRWLRAGGPDQVFPSVRMFVQPIKDPESKYKPVPLLIRRRQVRRVELGVDPVCAFDALLTLFLLDAGGVSPERLATTPLVSVTAGGDAVETCVLRADARAIAAAAGLPTEDVGGPSFRVGGAEDYYDVLGPGSEKIIDERGRWHTDISDIYKRCNATAHLEASAAIGGAVGVSLEALGEGWAQPGR